MLSWGQSLSSERSSPDFVEIPAGKNRVLSTQNTMSAPARLTSTITHSVHHSRPPNSCRTRLVGLLHIMLHHHTFRLSVGSFQINITLQRVNRTRMVSSGYSRQSVCQQTHSELLSIQPDDLLCEYIELVQCYIPTPLKALSISNKSMHSMHRATKYDKVTVCIK